MIARVIVAAALTLTMQCSHISTAWARSQNIFMPIAIDFGNYLSEAKPLIDDVSNRIMTSPDLTPNIDGGGLLVKGQFLTIEGKNRIVRVIYSWDGKTLARKSYPCSTTQIKRCGAAIVRDAEKVSIALQRSHAWTRYMSSPKR